MHPLVSVIIPCFNQGETIRETVDSVLMQNYEPVEIIVVNDGSTEHKTLSALADLPKGIKRIDIENSGPSVARNIAVSQCKGKYIVPLDGDDLIMPDTLAIAVNVLEQNDKIGVVYGNNYMFGAQDTLRIQAPINPRQIILYNMIAFCAVIRRAAYEQVGGLDEWMSKRGVEDWEFWIRLYDAGWQFKYVNQTFFKIRVNESSRTFQVANKNLDLLKEYVWNKHSKILAQQYELLYHENKNFPRSYEYRLGRFLLTPIKVVKKLFF